MTRKLTISAEARHQSRSFLQNTSDSRCVLPAQFNLDGSVAWRVGAYELVARGNNITGSKAYASGYASGDVSYYYVVPPRNLFVTVKVMF